MQIVSLGDNLHAMSKPIFWEKTRKIYNEFAHSTESVNPLKTGDP